MLFHPRWDPEVEAEGPVREVWLVEPAGPMTKLAIELWDVDPASKTLAEFTSGFPLIAAGLKTWLETGVPLSA